MDGWQGTRPVRIAVIVTVMLLAVVYAVGLAQQPQATRPAEEHDMRLVGHDDLQARSAYQPVIHKQGEVDDRGFVYLMDRADTGLHIVELTGAARAIANLP